MRYPVSQRPAVGIEQNHVADVARLRRVGREIGVVGRRTWRCDSGESIQDHNGDHCAITTRDTRNIKAKEHVLDAASHLISPGVFSFEHSACGFFIYIARRRRRLRREFIIFRFRFSTGFLFVSIPSGGLVDLSKLSLSLSWLDVMVNRSSAQFNQKRVSAAWS